MTSSAKKFFVCVFAIMLFCIAGLGDDGYRLWLRYDKLTEWSASRYRTQVKSLVISGNSATVAAIRDELGKGIGGLLGSDVPQRDDLSGDGALIVGTPQTSPLIAGLNLRSTLTSLGHEGFIIRTVRIKGRRATIIASSGETGLLYGAFHFLRLLQTLQPIGAINEVHEPRIQLRFLNHWDNLDGSIERGYAGKSLWNWNDLPGAVDPRYRDYARANASIGINSTVLNNVNANAIFLTPEYLRKVAAIADIFRPYGIKVYLSARFSAPIELGGLKTADPLDANVAAWWKKKADEIYAMIPDFGGFLVKANSEGQPGPRTYNRDHVDGANMMAAALAPHNGIVIWRAFVYDMKPGYDRAGAAYEDLQPFDGKFAANVLCR